MLICTYVVICDGFQYVFFSTVGNFLVMQFVGGECIQFRFQVCVLLSCLVPCCLLMSSLLWTAVLSSVPSIVRLETFLLCNLLVVSVLCFWSGSQCAFPCSVGNRNDSVSALLAEL